MNKVYCENCVHFNCNKRSIHDSECIEPSNRVYDSPFFKNHYYCYSSPEVRNSRNECSYFKEMTFYQRYWKEITILIFISLLIFGAFLVANFISGMIK